jgi:CHAD domain-containing protein
MVNGLTPDERGSLEWIADQAQPLYSRRARLLLLHDAGRHPREISAEVRLSVRRVYHWLSAFRQRRMRVFPRELLAAFAPASPLPTGEPAEGVARQPAAAAQPPQISVDELCARYQVDMLEARRVADVAMTLFDITAGIHQVAPERRRLLEFAAILHNVGYAFYPAKHHIAGRDIVLEHNLTELGRLERQVVACCIALHRKRFRPKRLDKEPSYRALPEELRHDTLILAALLRMARVLDSSMAHSTVLGEAQVLEQGIVVPLEGPAAEEGAARAQRRADLWDHIFSTPLRFCAQGQPVVWERPADAALISLALPSEKLKAPGILPDDAMSEAGRKVLRFHFQRMLEHEPGTREGQDIEELHDMRVATRRMRAAFRVFGEYYQPEVLRPLLKGLRATGRTLGGVRDLDVFMHKAQQYLDGLPAGERQDLDPLLSNWQAKREAARAEMLSYLDGKRYGQFARDLAAFVSTEGMGAVPFADDKPVPYQVRHVVPALIYDRYEAVRGYEAIIERASIETLHALRIDLKRLRYSLEFFREVLGPEADAVIKEVVVLQDHLGNLHDADVACGLLVGFLDEWVRAQGRERTNVSGVTRYLIAKQDELRALIDAFPAVWRNFDRADVRRGLALAVAAL